MANKKNKRTTNKRTNKPRPVRSLVRELRLGLDAQATAYARLLADPCDGSLTHSTFPGSSGTLISRFETDFVMGSEPTSVGTALFFTPGYMTENALSGGLMVPTTVLATDSGTIGFANSYTLQPGYTFLANNAKSFRSIAACMQVTWTGSELNRQGVVGVGQTNMANCMGGTQTLANLRVLASKVGRMPDTMAEIKLRPNDASYRFVDNTLSPTLATAQSVYGDLPSLFVTVSGIPGSTGVRIRLVNVVEWMPATATGITNPDSSYYSGRSTTQDVMNATKSVNWAHIGNMAYQVGGVAARFAGGFVGTANGHARIMN